MDIRRRMINTPPPPPTADNMFVIDSITIEEINAWFVIGYEIYLENINTMNSLKNFFVENGDYENEAYKLDPSKIELYLYDYKIPATNLYYDARNNLVSIISSQGVFPGNLCDIRGNNTIVNYGGPTIDGEWTFDHIPTTSVEAILFVEFAKQMGLDAFEIDNYNVYWHEEGKVLSISNGLEEYYVYGAYNDEKTGIIEFYDIYPDGGGGAD